MAEEFQFFVGIDWATEQHQVCAINARCELIAERAVENSGAGLASFLDWLVHIAHGKVQQVGVAIETPRGAVVESLMERGIAVFSINPKQLDRFRDRHTVAGAKDDRRDAFVLADSLRTDQPLFKRVRLDEPLIIRLRELSRLEDVIQQDSNRLINQLREQLQRYYPQLLQLCASANESWLWDLLQAAPLPDKGAKLSVRRVEQILRRRRIRRLSSAQVCDVLRTPPLPLAPGTAEAAAEHALLLLPQLRLVHQQRTEIARRIQAILDELAAPSGAEGETGKHRDVTLLLSLPGVGRVIAATMLAEASQALAERDYHALRAYGGAAPITRKSGKKRVVLMRRACNERMRNALYHWARVSSQADPRSKDYYRHAREAGHSHGRALRGLSDRLLAVLIAILNTGLPYDPAIRNTPQTRAS
jgi:transposase